MEVGTGSKSKNLESEVETLEQSCLLGCSPELAQLAFHVPRDHPHSCGTTRSRLGLMSILSKENSAKNLPTGQSNGTTPSFKVLFSQDDFSLCHVDKKRTNAIDPLSTLHSNISLLTHNISFLTCPQELLLILQYKRF